MAGIVYVSAGQKKEHRMTKNNMAKDSNGRPTRMDPAN